MLVLQRKTEEFSKTFAECAAENKKDNRMLGTTRIWIDGKTEDITTPLYESMVRPHLEHSPEALALATVRDKILAEVDNWSDPV